MVNQEYYKLGQKIRNFRIRSGKSQMELELEIGASAGSLSRIENGEVNPTKETLNRIIDTLGISGEEAADLFGIKVEKDVSRLVRFAEKFSSINNSNDLLQTAVNEAVKMFDISAASIFLVDEYEKNVTSHTFTDTWYTKLVRKMIPVPYESLTLPLEVSSSNLIVKSILEGKPKESINFEDFATPAISIKLTRLLKRLVKFESGISIPMLHEGKKVGAILFHKTTSEAFDKELKELISFTQYISLIVYNLNQFNELKRQLEVFEK